MVRHSGADMAREKEQERNLHPPPRPGPTGPLASRFDQMFPVLSPVEIDRVRHFGDVRRFRPGELLCRVGKPSPGMFVILYGRVAVVGRDALGRSMPTAEFAQLVGGKVEDLEVVPGDVLAELGQLSGKPSGVDAQAVDEVEAIVVPPDQLRALLIAEAELGERILRALILRHVAMLETGFGGPVLIGSLRSPGVTMLSGFLGRNALPFQVIDPDEDAEASSLVARYAPRPGDLPIVVVPG